jgi:predicted alpha/beta hydrolase family esterase
MRRFAPSDWDLPDLADWCAALTREVAGSQRPPVLVAHSLGCLLVAHWQARSPLPVAGAMLVSVPDPEGAAFPDEARGFADPPGSAFRFPSLIVASADDRFGSVAYSRQRAQQWSSGLVEVGPCGHINDASGVGDWPRGRELLTAFLAGLGRTP